MTSLRLAVPFAVFVGASLNACGSSDKQRAVIVADAGPDGAGASSGGSSSGTGGKPNQTSDSGAKRDGSTGDLDASADATTPGADSSVATDSGQPALGEYCVFADPDIESLVRGTLQNMTLPIDGGLPNGPIPVALASRITSLDLFCDCSGNKDLSGIECVTGLQTLKLSDSYSDLSPLQWLPNLTDLSFDYQNTVPHGLGTVKQLKKLNLSSNYVSDISELAGLTALTDLELASNSVADLTPLAGLTQLTKLSLSGNLITDVTPLAGLTKLQDLSLNDNQIADIGPLASLKALTTLNVARNIFTSLAALQGLTNLSFLDVSSQTPITDFSPLVNNTGIGSGDTVYGTPLLADCASFKADLATLTSRGVVLNGFPSCP